MFHSMYFLWVICMKSLRNKRVLFLSPKFFDYETSIYNAIIKEGALVDYFDERPFTSSIGKIVLRLRLNFLTSLFVDFYYSKILKVAKNYDYDFLFILIPESIKKKHILAIIKSNPSIKVIIYMWDSIKNRPHAADFINVADYFFSFDPSDCMLDRKIQFLPLFYTDDYISGRELTDGENNYNACFIGTIHSDRFSMVNSILRQLDLVGKNNFIYFYCPSYLLFILKKIFTRELDGVSFSAVSFVPLSKMQIIEVVKKSNLVIDIEHPNQVGLTMRTIEMLGSERKLITTNSDVMSYDFYNANNIAVVDRYNPILKPSIVVNEYVKVSEHIYNKYSLTSWVKNIFKIN